MLMVMAASLLRLVKTLQRFLSKTKKSTTLLTRARWSDDLLGNKIASIPFTVIDELNKQGIMRGFHIVDQKRMKAWLNERDNRVFRTRTGVV